jgi:hypothetical protein
LRYRRSQGHYDVKGVLKVTEGDTILVMESVRFSISAGREAFVAVVLTILGEHGISADRRTLERELSAIWDDMKWQLSPMPAFTGPWMPDVGDARIKRTPPPGAKREAREPDGLLAALDMLQRLTDVTARIVDDAVLVEGFLYSPDGVERVTIHLAPGRHDVRRVRIPRP